MGGGRHGEGDGMGRGTAWRGGWHGEGDGMGRETESIRRYNVRFQQWTTYLSPIVIQVHCRVVANSLADYNAVYVKLHAVQFPVRHRCT